MNRMRVLRVVGDLTQYDLAQKVGVSQSFISLVESRKAFPGEEIKEKIAKALGESKAKIFVD